MKKIDNLVFIQKVDDPKSKDKFVYLNKLQDKLNEIIDVINQLIEKGKNDSQ